MNEKTFDVCLNAWEKSDGRTRFWPELAKKFGYRDGESLRGAFKRERKRRGITKYQKENRIITKANAPKIVCFDIETSPLQVFSWGLWQQNIYTDQIIQDWHVITWGVKWLFDDTVLSECLTPKEAKTHDDKRIVQIMWDVLDQADVVIAHNARKFDVPRMNTRFLYYNMPPPSHYRVIDTLQIARSTFGFSSNKLDYINEILGLSMKKKTDFSLWKDCFYGEQDALEEMQQYVIQDTAILEELYLKLRPWIKSHPNWGLYVDTDKSICPNCGSENLEWKGYYYTPVGRYRSFRCECGAIGRSRKTDLSKEERKTLVK